MVPAHARTHASRVAKCTEELDREHQHCNRLTNFCDAQGQWTTSLVPAHAHAPMHERAHPHTHTHTHPLTHTHTPANTRTHWFFLRCRKAMSSWQEKSWTASTFRPLLRPYFLVSSRRLKAIGSNTWGQNDRNEWHMDCFHIQALVAAVLIGQLAEVEGHWLKHLGSKRQEQMA